jgi:hypothetical protein
VLGWLRFLHLLAALGFVAAQVTGDFISRALRKYPDWKARAALLDLQTRAAWSAGLGGLLLLGAFGNLLAMGLGHRMAESRWLQVSNALFLVTLLVLVAWTLPALRRLRLAARRAAEDGQAPPDFDRLRARWQAGHMALDVLYLVTLAWMVWR